MIIYLLQTWPPSSLKTKLLSRTSFNEIQQDLSGICLHTICEEAQCLNIDNCWGGEEGVTAKEGKRTVTATIVLMEATCTCGCRFCSVKTSRAPPPLDPHEPEDTAQAISRWGLRYIVLTNHKPMIMSSDLVDGGIYDSHFAEIIVKIVQRAPPILMEEICGHVSHIAKSSLDVYTIFKLEELTPFMCNSHAPLQESRSNTRRRKVSARPR
ncbi:hypothetical protein BDR07DRAFT_1300114 [Suillus spraguei]|nr:hypothetical protein BDR07DRAFT_1300114 [Suillus spraguei]